MLAPMNVPPHQTNVRYLGVRSTGQCNTACSLSAGVWKPNVIRERLLTAEQCADNLRMREKSVPLGEVLPQQAVGVLV